jgi:hypothetical protein
MTKSIGVFVAVPLAVYLFIGVAGGMVAASLLPYSVHAQAAAPVCGDRVLTFPAWYRGITDSSCNIRSPASFDTAPNKGDGLGIFLTKIGLNVIEFMLQLVGYLSVAFIIVGGYKYLTAAGAADDIVKAKKTILNAVIGLGISIFSVAIVNAVVAAL